MKKLNKIPNFKNLHDEADFWDRSDITNYLSELKPVKLKVNFKAVKDENLTIRLQPGLKKTLENTASDMGIQPSSLARMWLIEKLRGYTLTTGGKVI